LTNLELQYGEEIIQISVTRSKRKSLALSVGTDGVVKVKAPQNLSDTELLKWMKTKTGWIVRKRNEILQNPKQHEAKKFVSGETFSFLGEEYILEVRMSEARARSVGIVEDKLVVFIKPDAYDESEVQKKAVFEALTSWYEKQAHIWIPRRVRYYREVMKESIGRIAIKNQKSRWGSCSSARNLNFNWRLVMAPLEVLDYVVVHELCHLKQMNHSAAFWAEVEKILPDYRERKKWLEDNAKELDL